MKTFKLPDLGEGLPDAEIREWYVKPGDKIELDQPMVAMETAKALVDVPAPFAGTVEKLFGDVGDTIETGDPLIGFEGEAEEESIKDSGTVVGSIKESADVLEESATGVNIATKTTGQIKATPAVRALAKKLHVNLASITPAGKRITAEEVKAAAQSAPTTTEIEEDTEKSMEKLSAAKRAMVLSMTKSHEQVVPVTLCDDADLSAWKAGEDITVRLIRAVAEACKTVPVLNATFDGANMSICLNEPINLGIAVDTPHGLYVPVIKNIAEKSNTELREKLNQFKQQAKDKSIPQEDLKDGTIILSNFGAFAGRYANPVVTPPMVSIIGIGRTRDEVVAKDGKMEIHPILPISITVDHRAVTGGEVARFLQAMIVTLNKSE